jgi:sugar lactone lactonase YvrE
VSPSQGPIAGGTTITINGANLAGAAIRLDHTAIVPLSQSDTEVRFTAPAHDNGYVVIAVGNAYGRFLYVPPPFATLPPGFITTIAGVGQYKGEFGPATEAMINPFNLAYDASGNLYIGEENFDTVSRIRTDGIIERYAGRGSDQSNCCPDGPAADAYVGFPRGIALDTSGNLYIADHTYRIRRVDAVTHVITTIAGNGQLGFSGDGGPAASARIGLPVSIAVDKARNIYFTDMEANRIRRIDANGTITTVAGNGTRGFSGDGGPALQASYSIHDSDTGALAVDAAGNIYLGDYDNNRIRRIDVQTGVINTFVQWAQNGSDPFYPVGGMFCIAFDSAGNMYYGGKSKIIEVSPQANVLRSWGAGVGGFSPDGTPLDQARLGSIDGIAFDAAGNLVFSESSANKIRRMNFATGKLETIAGLSPEMIGEDGPAVGAVLKLEIADCAIAPNGDLLVADGRVRRLQSDGRIVTIAGRNIGGGIAGDNVPALTAPLNALAIYPDHDGSIDTVSFGSTVNRIDPNGINHIVVGFSDCGYSGDGQVAKSLFNTLCQPWDAVRDRDGNLFIADTNNNRIRRVDAKTGVITTVAGNGGPVNGKENRGHGTFCGDGGPALDACFNTPYSIVFDDGGNLFVTDWWNNRIRRIDGKSGIITTFAEVFGVFNLTFDRWGRLYTNQRDKIIRFDRSGAMSIVAGSGLPGFSGDGGPALQARMETLQQSSGIAVDAEGNVFFVDNANRRVRAVRYGAVVAPPNATVQASVSGISVRAVVRDGSGKPAPGVRVDFAAPAAGATCTLSSSYAVTGDDGVAAVSCDASCIAGSYAVTARPLAASSSASVTLTNRSGGPCRRRVTR